MKENSAAKQVPAVGDGGSWKTKTPGRVGCSKTKECEYRGGCQKRVILTLTTEKRKPQLVLEVVKEEEHVVKYETSLTLLRGTRDRRSGSRQIWGQKRKDMKCPAGDTARQKQAERERNCKSPCWGPVQFGRGTGKNEEKSPLTPREILSITLEKRCKEGRRLLSKSQKTKLEGGGREAFECLI